MSEQFLYAQFNFTPKAKADKTEAIGQCAVFVEVPKDLVLCEHLKSLTGTTEEKILALGIARITALGTFPKTEKRVAEGYDEGVPLWREERHPVMNERPCDHEENGIRAWMIV
jgi:hypothetical protein